MPLSSNCSILENPSKLIVNVYSTILVDPSLEQYLQEAGRAGRDGRTAHCILLYAPADRTIHEALQTRSRVRPQQLYRLGRALCAWAAEGRSPSLNALAVSAELGPRTTAALLVPLEEAGLIEHEEKTIRVRTPPSKIESQARALAGQFETLRVQDTRRLDALAEYAATESCRALYLRSYFGEEDGEPCGLCDICREATRPAGFFKPLNAPQPVVRKKTGRAGKRRRRRGGQGAVRARSRRK